jgi:hypothetical protein
MTTIDPGQFVTCGIKHLRFWTLAGSQVTSKRGILGRGERMQTMTSLGFGANDITYSGAMNGSIYVWNGIQVPLITSYRMGF